MMRIVRRFIPVILLALALIVLGSGQAQPASAATATALSAGSGHTCVVATAGGLKCWGQNGNGQLGDGTSGLGNFSSTPVDVVGLSRGVATVSAGFRHTCALTTAGGLKCWGDNRKGQLGDGTQTERNTPVDVCAMGATRPCTAANNNILTGVAAVSAGAFGHTCAVTTTGGVLCWGDNGSGQLGDGNLLFRLRLTPVDVVGLSGVGAVSAGGAYSCALTGGLKCWGFNSSGQLGDGTTTSRATPVDVVGLTSGVTGVAAGFGHTCALTTESALKCWGDNRWGGLGDGTSGSGNFSSTPVDVVGLSSGVAGVSAAVRYSCAMTAAGGVKCWGDNDNGQLGDGTFTNRTTPVDVTGLTSGVAAVSAGGSHACVLTTAGGLKCWGNNLGGKLGDGTTTNRTTPVDVIGFSPPADSDGDGISNNVDGAFVGGVFVAEDTVFSDNFTDENLGGTSFGSIVDRGGLSVEISDADGPADGLLVEVLGGGGTATIDVCGSVVKLTSGDSAIFTCGSLTTQVVVGPVEILLGDEIVVTQPSGTTTTITEGPEGQFQVENASDSEGTVVIQLHGQQLTINPGEVMTNLSDLCGDQNGDGFVNVFDAIIELQIIVGLTTPTELQLILGDVVGDGAINVFDVILTLQHIVGSTQIAECGPP